MRMRQFAARLMVLLTLAASLLVVAPSSANAAVWNCYSKTYGTNSAGAWCDSGFGYYRVRATCNSPYWPYTTTIYGPWIYRSSTTTSPPWSTVFGDNYGCHVVSSGYQVK